MPRPWSLRDGVHPLRRRTVRGLADVEHAALDYVDWFNHRRLHGEIGMVPPVEFEVGHSHHQPAASIAVSQ